VDALFATRSKVKHGHDRYANIKAGYLLQWTEGWPEVRLFEDLAGGLPADLVNQPPSPDDSKDRDQLAVREPRCDLSPLIAIPWTLALSNDLRYAVVGGVQFLILTCPTRSQEIRSQRGWVMWEQPPLSKRTPEPNGSRSAPSSIPGRRVRLRSAR
jgi:hypothetical protein